MNQKSVQSRLVDTQAYRRRAKATYQSERKMWVAREFFNKIRTDGLHMAETTGIVVKRQLHIDAEVRT